MCEKICKTCGGEDAVAIIAEKMGFMPDAAFARIRKLEEFIRNGVHLGYIKVPDAGDPELDMINEIIGR